MESENESKFKIKLSKSSGYDSKLVVYTFQSKFIKIFTQTIPKKMMPDVSKNTQLEGTAYALVGSVDDIDETWQKLRFS